jgi:hypothetical protein
MPSSSIDTSYIAAAHHGTPFPTIDAGTCVVSVLGRPHGGGQQRGWVVISMKNDWRRMFAWEK